MASTSAWRESSRAWTPRSSALLSRRLTTTAVARKPSSTSTGRTSSIRRRMSGLLICEGRGGQADGEAGPAAGGIVDGHLTVHAGGELGHQREPDADPARLDHGLAGPPVEAGEHL